MTVEPDQARLHGHDREADAEHDVRDQDRPEAEDHVQVQKERQQRGAEHDLRRGQRQEDQEVRRPSPAEAIADERERDQRSERRGDQARESAISSERTIALRIPGTPSQSRQLSQVKPCQV